jgi:hypothetical protein
MAWTTPKTWTGGAGVYLLSTDLNTHVRDNLEFLKTNIDLEAAAALTIATGAVTATQAYHKLAGEGAAADDLDTISGGSEGDVLFIRPNGQAITLKDGTGNLDLNGDILLNSDDDHIALIYGSDSAWHPVAAPRTAMTFMVNNFLCPAPGTDWTPCATGATLAAEKSAKKCWMPLDFLKIGDIVVSYKLVGDVIEAATATLDCKLVQINKADPLTTTDITDGAISQITADGNFDSAANPTDTTVATDKQYNLELLGTTGAGDTINVAGAEILIYRLA